MEFYAHLNKDHKELLIDHLKKTGKLAEQFSSEFGYGKLGLQLGLLHDVGKHTERFQKVLQRQLKKIDHAVVSAECYADLADQSICDDDFIYLMICNCLNAHHSILRGEFKDPGFDGVYPLPDHYDLAFTDDRGKQNALSSEEEYQTILDFIEENHLILPLTKQDMPDTEAMSNAEKMLFVRMMQSCLVDADYSSTAAFEDPEYAKTVEDRSLDPDALLKQLSDYHERLVQSTDPENEMNQLRNRVYHDAAEAGHRKIQLYTLTAPTGTAKTLAMMQFALTHAKTHGLRRILIVLPYLSITTQNTETYRKIFGDEVVLEDDSMTEYPDEVRMYADRWNSPIIVTTSVKFFETLQAAKASDLRRLHEITNAVVVFDEAQTLGSEFTDITIKTLTALPKQYRTTVVLSTATQPAYQYRNALKDFLASEIIEDPAALYRDYEKTKKTDVTFSIDQEWSVEALRDNLCRYPQALCVSNTTNKVLHLYKSFSEKFEAEQVFYLSSRLCPGHKKEVIRDVAARLKDGMPCYLLSTQCIEAGVDFDFPAGAREYASLTAISQTAGRINRNGTRQKGEMLVFRSDQNGTYDFPSEAYHNEADITYYMVMNHPDKRLNTNSLQDIREYYQKLYSGDSIHGYDKKPIRDAENECDLKGMSEAYQLISDRNQCNVIVPYEKRMDEFDALVNILSNQNYTLTKKELYAHHGLTVSVTVNGKSLDYIKTHCHQLSLYAPGQAVLVNWYIADMDEIYDKKTGLKTKEDSEEGGMFDV